MATASSRQPSTVLSLLASLVPDEAELLTAIFGDEVSATADWSRTHGIATLNLSLHFSAGTVPVVVVLTFTSTTSGPLGTATTEFGAPCLNVTATTTLSMATTSGLVQTVEDQGLEGATLSTDQLDVDPVDREWLFSSGGWLVGLVGGIKEILDSDNRVGDGNTSMGPSSADVSGIGLRSMSTTSAGSAGQPRPSVASVLRELPAGGAVVLTARAYRLTHMRRPVDYIRTLHSWFNSVSFNGTRGFVSSVTSMDVGTVNVYVAALHVEVVQPCEASAAVNARPPSATTGSFEPGSAGAADFSVLERQWKTQPVDVDAKGKPCFERLMRVVADSRNFFANPAPVAAALDQTKVPLTIGEPHHVVMGVGNFETPAWIGGCNEREKVEAVVLHVVGLQPFHVVPRSPKAEASGSPAPKAFKSAGAAGRGVKGAAPPTSPDGKQAALFSTFVAEVSSGGLFS